MTLGLALQLLGASLMIALGAIFAAVGAIEEAVVVAALGGWWLFRSGRRL